MRILLNSNDEEYFNRICPYCKEQVTIHRNGNKDIFFDGQVYHKECFLTMNQVHKKCKKCQKTFSFSNVSDHEFILYQGSFYCIDCFQSLCDDGIKRNSRKWKNAYANIEKYKTSANTKIQEALTKKHNTIGIISACTDQLNKYSTKIYAEHDVNVLIKDNYNIIDPSVFYKRYLRPLYDGKSEKYENITIPAYHLLEMWQTKLNYFNKLYQRNISRGKEFTPTQRAAYDLSILVSQYESFLEWKTKQDINESDDIVAKPIKEQQAIIKNTNPSIYRKPDNCDADVSEILDDIFG